MIKYIGSKRRLIPVLGPDLPGLRRPHRARSLHRHHPRRPGLQGPGCPRHRRRQRPLRPRLRPHLHRDRRRHRRRRPAGRPSPTSTALPGKPGYVTEMFSHQARFFQPLNAARIDAVRDAIDSEYAGSPLFPLLLTSLIEAADRVDSTTGRADGLRQAVGPPIGPADGAARARVAARAGARHPGRRRRAGRAPTPDWATSTWPTSIRPTTSTGTSPTTTCGRRWWPGTRPRPTAWPASASMPETPPPAAPSTRSAPCPTHWRRWCGRWTASCWCSPTTTSHGWAGRARGAVRRPEGRTSGTGRTAHRRTVLANQQRGGHLGLRLGSLCRGPHRHLRPLRAQGGPGGTPLEPGTAGHRRRAGAGAAGGRRGGGRAGARPTAPRRGVHPPAPCRSARCTDALHPPVVAAGLVDRLQQAP